MAPARSRARRRRTKRSRQAVAASRSKPRNPPPRRPKARTAKSSKKIRTPKRATTPSRARSPGPGRAPRDPAPSPSAAPAPASDPAPSDAEWRLLKIARQITIDRAGLPAALQALAEAYAPDGALPGALFRAWTTSRDDKTAALALAWAREQVRLALKELIERGPRQLPRRPPSPDTLAWLLLAGAEAICQEPPSAAADRLRALLELAGHAEPGPAPPPPIWPRERR